MRVSTVGIRASAGLDFVGVVRLVSCKLLTAYLVSLEVVSSFACSWVRGRGVSDILLIALSDPWMSRRASSVTVQRIRQCWSHVPPARSILSLGCLNNSSLVWLPG